MNPNEMRMRSMQKSDLYPCLNDADRAAIEWMFNEVFRARDATEQARRELHEAWQKGVKIKDAVEAALVPLLKAVN